MPTLPCRSGRIHRPVRDGFRLPDSQSRQHTVKTYHDALCPFSAVSSQFSPVIMDLVAPQKRVAEMQLFFVYTPLYTPLLHPLYASLYYPAICALRRRTPFLLQ